MPADCKGANTIFSINRGLSKEGSSIQASSIEQNRNAYYAAFQDGSQRSLEITEWLVYFGKMVLAAQDYTLELVSFLVGKGKFFARYGANLNERQSKAFRWMFDAGTKGFERGLPELVSRL